MKTISILLTTLFFALTVQAQEVGVKVDNINATQDTTITIKKGSTDTATQPATPKKKWAITEGEEEIIGDKDVVLKKAEKNWKAACSEWKKEFKEMNKENKIMSMSCGKMTCTKEGVESTCASMAKHKMKVLEEEQ